MLEELGADPRLFRLPLKPVIAERTKQSALTVVRALLCCNSSILEKELENKGLRRNKSDNIIDFWQKYDIMYCVTNTIRTGPKMC